jgi:hypothetical protein
MKLKIISLIFSLTALLNISCNTTEPPVDNLQPGGRDYVWTVDTLLGQRYPFTGIWGSSPNDVWICGEGGIDNDGLQHFDGEKWTPFKGLSTGPKCIFGFSSNNIWIGGTDGAILHYDGNLWKKVFTYTREGQYIVEIVDIWGQSINDLYAVGYYIDKNSNRFGFILHFNGNTWKEEFFGPSNILFLKVRKEDNEVFLLATKSSNISDSIFIYNYSNQNLKEMYSKARNQILNFNNINRDIYFLIENKLYDFNSTNTNLNETITIPTNFSAFDIYGKNEKDIFLTLTDGIAHYNGENVEYLYQFPSYQLLTRGIIFETEVFFVVADFVNVNLLMLRGILINNDGNSRNNNN